MGESRNQPSSVQDDGPMGCKLLLGVGKVADVFRFCTYRQKKDRLIPCQQPR